MTEQYDPRDVPPPNERLEAFLRRWGEPPMPPSPHRNGMSPKFNGEISVGNLLTIAGGAVVLFLAYGQWTAANERLINQIAAMDRKFTDRTDNIVADIQSRRAMVNTKLDEQTKKTDEVPLIRDAIKRLEGVNEAQLNRFESSRGERIQNDKEMQTSINRLSTEVALLRQSVEGAKGQAPNPPFTPNQTWNGPRFPFAPKAIGTGGDVLFALFP